MRSARTWQLGAADLVEDAAALEATAPLMLGWRGGGAEEAHEVAEELDVLEVVVDAGDGIAGERARSRPAGSSRPGRAAS